MQHETALKIAEYEEKFKDEADVRAKDIPGAVGSMAVLLKEEESFRKTLNKGLKELRKMAGKTEQLTGNDLFNESCNDLSKMKMDLSELKKLKRIEIGNECFKHVREFVIDGLESLESVKIGEDCFRIDDEECDDGVCRITNCPNLRQLEIGDHSFADFKSFELSNLNSIQSIKFGEYCFEYADFSLKGE